MKTASVVFLVHDMDMNGCLVVKSWLTINLELDGIVGLYPVLGNSDCHVGSISLLCLYFFLAYC